MILFLASAVVIAAVLLASTLRRSRDPDAPSGFSVYSFSKSHPERRPWWSLSLRGLRDELMRYPEEGIWPALDQLLFLLVLCLVVMYLSSFCHEVGHALLARSAGLVVASFGMGLGRPLLVWSWGDTRVYLGRTKPTQGVTFALSANGRITPRQRLLMLAGGVSANIVLALVAWGLFWLVPAASLLWWVMLGMNGVLALVNLVPLRIALPGLEVHSDGAQMLLALRGKTILQSPPQIVEKTPILGRLWRDIGDHLSLYSQLVQTAAAWLEMGDVEHAENLLHQAEVLSPVAPPSSLARTAWVLQRALGAQVMAVIACKRHRCDEALVALDRAEAGFREAGHELGTFLVAWTRVEVALERGDPEALVQLDELAGKAPTAARVGLLVSRLCAHAGLPDGAGVDALRAKYEAERGKHPSTARDIRVYRKLAGLYARLQDHPRAVAVYREATTAAEKLHIAFSNAEEQARFARAVADLLAEAREYLQRGGDTVEAERLEKLFSSQKEVEQKRRAAQEQRQRAQRRLGVRLALCNLVALAGLIGLVVHVDSRATTPAVVHFQGLRLPLAPQTTLRGRLVHFPARGEARLGPWCGFLLLSLVLWTALGLACAFFLWLGGRLFSRLKRHGGAVVVYLALFPWLTVAGYVLLRAFL
jgi:Zn-dependent protease